MTRRPVGLPEAAPARRRAPGLVGGLITAPQPDPVAPPAGVSGGNAAAPRLPVDRIAFDPNNASHRIQNVEDIASTIHTVGIIQPLSVASRDAYLRYYPQHADRIGAADYVAIEGNRRLAAAQRAGLSEVPVDVNDNLVGDGRDRRVRIIANLRREGLDPISEARDLDELLAEPGMTTELVAQQVGCAKSHVSKRRSLLNLLPEIQQEVALGRMQVTDARLLVDLAHEHQREAFAMIRQGSKTKHAVGAVHARLDLAARRDADRVSARAHAARDEVCVKILADPSEADERARLVAAYVVRGAATGAVLQVAHRWLRSAGVGPDVADPKSYAAAMAQGPGVELLAYAIALAADELHARARRGVWDARAVDHYRRLLARGYVSSEWDAARLP